MLIQLLEDHRMKDFMTIKETATKWGICERRINTLCLEGRVEGAQNLVDHGRFRRLHLSPRMRE